VPYQSFLSKILKNASRVANKNFGQVGGILKPKSRTQILTKTDLAISRLIIAAVRKNYPEHNIIDEETGVVDRHSVYTWVIDPIDGTVNFAHGVPLYGVMIGLLKQGCPIAGGVALPAFNQIYTAEKGKGAYCNDKIIHTAKPKRGFAILSYTIGGYPEAARAIAKKYKTLSRLLSKFFLQTGSGSVFDSMMVAKGGYAANLFSRSKIWDNVAEDIIITEAGGVYTDFNGRPKDYTNPLSKTKKNYTACAAHPAIHNQIQKIIHQAE